MRLYSAFIALFLLTTSTTRAQDDDFSRRSLKGIKGVHIVVDLSPGIAEDSGLSTIALRTDIELKLQQASIPVLATGDPYLYVGILVVPSSDKATWPYAVTVELHQPVALTRDSSITVQRAITWNVLRWGDVDKQNLRNLRTDVQDTVDMFINAYLAVNQ
jgi:hypothetical protein